ncbi:hypothetical protein Trydic_g4538 [Trypoxylus dichotomus]
MRGNSRIKIVKLRGELLLKTYCWNLGNAEENNNIQIRIQGGPLNSVIDCSQREGKQKFSIAVLLEILPVYQHSLRRISCTKSIRSEELLIILT